MFMAPHWRASEPEFKPRSNSQFHSLTTPLSWRKHWKFAFCLNKNLVVRIIPKRSQNVGQSLDQYLSATFCARRQACLCCVAKAWDPCRLPPARGGLPGDTAATPATCAATVPAGRVLQALCFQAPCLRGEGDPLIS